ncbi:hypothetical protein ACQEVF_22345 [Nonomuraea polychroma]|uniref:hypothetical protein n=1 Tax=Nonomuraea polychroma TaxID=46176 RepID=UPI003D8AEC00
MSALVVAGTFTALTYVTPFLTEVSTFSAGAIGPLLLLRGIASVLGVAVSGHLVDRYAGAAIAVPVAAQAAGAGSSTAFNVGITAGALIGSGLLPGFGVRSTALVGGLLSLAGLVLLISRPGGRSRHGGREPRHRDRDAAGAYGSSP